MSSKIDFIFNCVYVWLYVCMYICMYLYVIGQTWDPLELKLQVVVSHWTWVLGTELGPEGEQYVLLPSELCFPLS